jgi:hypothetical protein
MITPTIGRRVWYWPNGTTGMSLVPGSDQACDAGVCYVWGDRMVNLTVADHAGAMHSRTSVTLLQDDDTPPIGSAYATWMPYQTGQAKASA